MKKQVLVVSLTMLIILAALVLNSNSSRAQETKFHHTENAIANQYIVVLEDEVSESLVNSTAQSLTSTYGGQVGVTYEHALKGFTMSSTETNAIALSNDPLVDYVTEDGVVTVSGTQLNPPSWGLDRIDQGNLPLNNTYTFLPTGAGVNAYVIDTGIRTTHQEFHGRAFVAADFVGGNGQDCNGHGTHVAGIIGSSKYGVAKGVKLHAVRVIGCGTTGSISAVIQGVNWVTANRISPAIANLSIGATGINNAFDQAVRTSIASGVQYMIGAGNDGVNANNVSPARVFEACTVAASDIFDQRSIFSALSSSNFGSVVDLFAPGSLIPSTWWDTDTSEQTISGTSMAAPHVTGVGAQYLQINPSASPASVCGNIVNNATTGVITNPGTGSPNRLLYSRFLPPPPRPTFADFDDDAKSDVSTWRPGTGEWWVLNSSNSSVSGVAWGGAIHNDQIVPGDYDGDQKTDRAVWRPGDGIWYIIDSSTNTPRYPAWGTSGDIPVPADYDGDNITDLAVWRPSTGVWYIVNSSNASIRYETFGTSGDKPVAADYDGDGKTDVAVWRPSDGVWYILQSATGTVRYETFGGASFSDVLVPADYDGDLAADVAVWRPGAGVWYILQSSTGTVRYETFGLSSDIPSVADFDGDGKADVTMWRPSVGQWYILESSNLPTVRYETFGASTDIPVPSAYNRY